MMESMGLVLCLSVLLQTLLLLHCGHTLDLRVTSGVDVGERTVVGGVHGVELDGGPGTGGAEWDRVPTPPAALAALAPKEGTESMELALHGPPEVLAHQ